ncbi:MAG: hypothetical protein DI533_17565 [Cereibacter sphaeroides]|uniref:Response regulatory domain-containing protein n=1 Tax=Cereibacter sphaeroides TaxID=1063 RepID=A0A2W5S4B8_CERSP|nr:MAG: hypothetical protein DI533_17565 [Cereibacter sphaeroides]
MPVPDHIPPGADPAQGQQPALPLQGLTILAVEDSRFASEALRLLCLRSGARLRRAETMAAAARHLALYRPDAVIVDLGLPDGDGAQLIARLSQAGLTVFGTSGDPEGSRVALYHGARAFFDKPMENIAIFQSYILSHIPGRVMVATDKEGRLQPDRLALQDDLLRAAELLGATPDGATRRYVAGFLGSIAQSARDPALAQAARRAAISTDALPQLHALLNARLAAGSDVFAVPENFVP